MTVYIGGLVVGICPALETAFGVVHDGAVAIADAIVVLIPWRDLVKQKEAVIVLAFRLNLSR